MADASHTSADLKPSGGGVEGPHSLKADHRAANAD